MLSSNRQRFVLAIFFLYVFDMKKLLSLFIASFLLTGCGITITFPVPEVTHLPSSSIHNPQFSILISNFRIPILMYHHIGTYPKNADQMRRNLTVSTKSFEAQLKVLAQKGYQAVTFYDLDAYQQGKQNLPEKPIMLTFDDGYDDNYESAWPLLEAYRQKGIFYIITDKVDTLGYMTWHQIQVIHTGGNEIGSHTKTHPDLKLISGSDQKLVDEVVESKTILEGKALGPIISFCYPSGAFNEKVAYLVEEHYEYARTTKPGIFTPTSRRTELPTLRMQEGVDLNELLP